MSNLSSKLANSVRQAKDQQQKDQSAAEDLPQEPPKDPAPAKQPVPAKQASRRPATSPRKEDEAPLPKIPSRRVWPD